MNKPIRSGFSRGMLKKIVLASAIIFLGAIRLPAEAIECVPFDPLGSNQIATCAPGPLQPMYQTSFTSVHPLSDQLVPLAIESVPSATNEVFLWGLIGFGATFVAGSVGILAAHDGLQASNNLTVGTLAGGSALLFAALVCSNGRDILTPAYVGGIIGILAAILVGTSTYPEMVLFLL